MTFMYSETLKNFIMQKFPLIFVGFNSLYTIKEIGILDCFPFRDENQSHCLQLSYEY